MPQVWVPTHGLARRIMSVVSAAVVTLSLIVAIPIAIPSVTSAADAAVDSCGVDVVLILDASGSMTSNSNAGINAVRDGVNAFVSELNSVAPSSRVGIVRFGVPASADVPYTSVGSAALANYMNNVGGTGYRAYTGSNSFTNWDAALAEATSEFTAANAVIFITDGNPNRSIGNSYSDNVAGWNLATAAALGSANALKAKTTGRVYGVGAGSAFTSTPSPSDPVTPFGRLDQVVESGSVTSFADLTDSLPNLVGSICAPSLDIEKTTNGAQADTAPGPTIPAGDAVTWSYTVTNTGRLTVYDITVTDDNNDGATITCPGGNGSFDLDPGESTVCSASSISWFAPTHELHANTATATGAPLNRPAVNDSDDSHYTPSLVCPFDATGSQILIDIHGDASDGGYLAGGGSSVGPIAVNVPAGYYHVSWASYDAHAIGGESNPGETLEQWYLDFASGDSASTSDVPWNQDFAQGSADSILNLGSPETQVTVRHSAPGSTAGGVYAICAMLDPIDPGSIGITKTLVTDGDLYDGDVATFSVTIANGSDDESVTVTSLTENIGGTDIDLLATPDAAGLVANTCNDDLPITIAPNGSVDCSFSIVVSAAMTSASDDRCDPDGKIDVVSGEAVGQTSGAQSSDDDCESILINPDPTLSINKTVISQGPFFDADEVTFGVAISNNSDTEAVTIDSLTDDVGGIGTIDLLAPGLAPGLESNTCNSVSPLVIPAGGSVDCTFSMIVSSAMSSATADDCPNPDGKVDVVEASGTGNESGKSVSDDDCADITVNSDSEITVDKSKTTDGNYFDGDEAVFEVQVYNESDTESVTIDTLTENIGGADIDLLANPIAAGLVSNTCNDNPTITIAAGGVFTCTFSITVSIDMTTATHERCVPGLKVDVVAASGVGDRSGKSVSDSDCEKISVTEEPGGELTIDKTVYDPSVGEYVDLAFLPSSTPLPTTVEWQITVTNPTEWTVENIYLVDANAAACEVAFVAALEAIAVDKDSLDPGESVTFTCESEITSVPSANTAVAGGTDILQRPIPEVEDSAAVGQVQASATIGDTVWYDTNGNGIQDGSEAGIAGAPVKLTGVDGQDVDPVTPGVQTELSRTTDANGKYLFSGLPDGNYKVTVSLATVPNPGTQALRFTTASSFSVLLPDGGAFLDADFGVVADQLPTTGISTDNLVLIALILMAAGVVAVLATRREDEGTDDQIAS